MVGEASLLEVVVAALRREAAVRVVTLFGLRARGGATGADGASDVDLQVITRRPGRLADRAWLEAAVAPQRVRAWTVRAAFGGVKKVSARGDGGEVDLVVLPWAWLRVARGLVALGVHRRSAGVAAKLGDLAVVLRPGFRVLHGDAGWRAFLLRVVDEVPMVELDAEAVVIDAAVIERFIARGELRAAQRWLHTPVGEVNWRLWGVVAGGAGGGGGGDAVVAGGTPDGAGETNF